MISFIRQSFKYKKEFNPKLNEHRLGVRSLRLIKANSFGFKVLNFRILYSRHFELIKRFLQRKFKKNVQIIFHKNVLHSYTKKPNEVRMGKGKGNVVDYFTLIRPGQLLFEINTQAFKLSFILSIFKVIARLINVKFKCFVNKF